MINLLGLAFLIVFTIFAYKTAKDYERNAIGWAILTFGLGFTIQIILPVVLVFILAVVMTATGSSPADVQEEIPFFTITIAGIVLSFISGILILRYLSKIPEEKPFDAPPTPPSDFNQSL